MVSSSMTLLTQWPPGYQDIGLPPLELIEPFLEPPANFTGHVGWNGVDKAHPEADFNPKTREAIFRWPLSGEIVRNGRTEYVSSKRYPVVRLLFYYRIGTPLARVTIENTCDNMACCNIEHWRVVSTQEIAAKRRIVVYTGFDSPHYKRQK